MRYAWKLESHDGNHRTWATSGAVEVSGDGQFYAAIDQALRDAFHQLTSGKAIYGYPGLACRGPYDFTKLSIEEEPQ